MMKSPGMTTYCLGYAHLKCVTCQHEANWQTLNQMPDELRIAVQAQLTRINIDECRMTRMGEYQPAAALATGKDEK
jgi:hypothetical protein